MPSSSARFAAIYDTLPVDVQNAIVEKQLIPLLDSVSKAKRKKLVASANKMKRRHASIPMLDLKAKTREIEQLLEMLHRDGKRAMVKERSQRTDLLEQTVQSVTSWLNDIWRVVYEHNVEFMTAHQCLLFTVDTLQKMDHGRVSCRCAFTSMYLPITLKRKTGKIVKSWQINGAHNLLEVLQFIWRDLFLSMLATGSQRQIQKIPAMLEEIEDKMSWNALERLLYGGRKCPHDMDDIEDDVLDESDTDEDDDCYTDEDSDLDQPVGDHDWLPKLTPSPSPSHARHWSHRISSQMWQFRKHVHAAMTAVFKINPSLRLYSSLIASSTDPDTTTTSLLSFLNQMGTSCSEVFTAALDIYALENNTSAIHSLLSTHSHLIRPRDAPIFQSAITTLAADPFYHQHALETIEKELLDTARAVRAALVSPFSKLDSPANRTELEQILKQRATAPGRTERLEQWVDDISTPGTTNPNPMAIAAMVMGLPIVPALDGSDDADPLGYLDLDPDDPDMEDLREEFRPRLKQRFEGWADTATAVRGGGTEVLVRVYRELAKTMPFLRASDVVEEMLTRLTDKPSKLYLIDAVDALSAFVKVQRRKLATNKTDSKRRATHASAQPSSSSSSSVNVASTAAYTFGTPPPPLSTDTTPGPSGPREAEDERAETPPPPLEAVTPAPGPLFTFYTGHIPLPPPGPDTGGGGGYGGGFGGMEDVD